jgi:hypothetical protein
MAAITAAASAPSRITGLITSDTGIPGGLIFFAMSWTFIKLLSYELLADLPNTHLSIPPIRKRSQYTQYVAQKLVNGRPNVPATQFHSKVVNSTMIKLNTAAIAKTTKHTISLPAFPTCYPMKCDQLRHGL